uniref:Uncharacterized protein n=1 Tax=Oryza glaberrima TaxID=4538 RepID=I1PUZ9_ORYGL
MMSEASMLSSPAATYSGLWLSSPSSVAEKARKERNSFGKEDVADVAVAPNTDADLREPDVVRLRGSTLPKTTKLRGEQHATDSNPVGLGFSTSKLTTIEIVPRVENGISLTTYTDHIYG